MVRRPDQWRRIRAGLRLFVVEAAVVAMVVAFGFAVAALLLVIV